MTSSTVVTLSGQIAKLLISEPSDSAQLADLASALNVMREAIRDEETRDRIEGLILDVAWLAQEYSTREALEDKHYHEEMRRRA